MRLEKKDILVLIPATLLAIAGLGPDDPWVVGPCLLLSWATFIVICVIHDGDWGTRLTVGIVITVILAGVGYRRFSSIFAAHSQERKNALHKTEIKTAFPWIGSAYRNTSSPSKRGFQLLIRDYPVDPREVNMILSVSSLFHVHLTLSEITTLSPKAEAWTERSIRIWRQEEWNTDDTGWDVNWYLLQKKITVFTLRGQSRDGDWEGYLILHQGDDTDDTKQAIRGTINLNGEIRSVSLTEERINKSISRKNEFTPLTKADLVKLGIPFEGEN